MNYLDFHSPARVGKHYLCNLDDAESESANQPTANSDLTKAYAVLPPPLGPFEVKPYMLL